MPGGVVGLENDFELMNVYKDYLGDGEKAPVELSQHIRKTAITVGFGDDRLHYYCSVLP